MSDDVRREPDQPETGAEHKSPENEVLEADAASGAATPFEQAGGVGLEPVAQEHPELEVDEISESPSPAPAKLERLQKILAQAGIASRRHAEELITGGRVQVNGQVVTELGSKADPARDHIRVDGKLLQGSERHRYFMLNKPKGFVTTVSDPEGRPTIMQFFAKMRERLYPVGRLDYMSEGLLLVTNDGELANKLTKAASGVEKTYLVKVSGEPTEEELERLRQGVSIDRGKPGSGRVHAAPAQIRKFRAGRAGHEHQAGRPRTGANPWFEVILVEGRNRELRKMFEEIGHHVEKIRRVGYGPLVLDLEPGKFRELEPEEVENLRKAADGKYHKPKSREPRQRAASPRPERRAERPQWKERQPGGRPEGVEDRGKFRRNAAQSFGADRDRGPKRGQFGTGNRFSGNRFNEKREDRPPHRDRGDRPFGESRERRGGFAQESPRGREGNFKRFGARSPQPNFADSGKIEGGPPERQRFGRGDRKPFGQKPFHRDREDLNRPRREGKAKLHIEERGGPQPRFSGGREAKPRFERPRREGNERGPGEGRGERRSAPKPFVRDREAGNRFERPRREGNEGRPGAERGERRSASKPFVRDREARNKFERPRREGNERGPGAERGERRGAPKPFVRDREARNKFERPRREESESRPRGERGERPGQPQVGRPDPRSSAPRAGGFRGKPGTFGAKSGSMRSGGGRRPGSRHGGKPGGKRRP